jgi:hypothetical protein
MEQAKLDPLTNMWTDIHDFAAGPGHYTLADGKRHETDLIAEQSDALGLPCYVPQKGSARHFTVTVAVDQMDDLIELTQTSLCVIRIVRSQDGKLLYCFVQANSKREIKDRFAHLHPVSIKTQKK